MNYLINPWYIYLIDKIDTLLIFAGMILFLVACVIVCGTLWYLNDSCGDEDDRKKIKKIFIPSIILGVLSLLILIVCPSSKTVTKMVVASYVTEENVDKAEEQVVEIIDYIFEKVDEVSKRK